MYKNLQFKISSGLKNIIGKDLITDDFSAIFELVKNSYDAHSSQVSIIFENLITNQAKITILDDGKGMNLSDIKDKWLFVAYSAKEDGTEDMDYRDKIQGKMYYAGAKGIGRFSCDKLGTKLLLKSKKDENNSKVEEVFIDWELFEKDIKKDFLDIHVKHRTLKTTNFPNKHGTLIEVSNLRDTKSWDKDKVIKLKKSLAKLINPFKGVDEREFKINIIAKEYLHLDENETNQDNHVNGLVKNKILEILDIKTARIISEISGDGNTITTEFSDNSRWLYKIEEKNSEYTLLNNIIVELYFLDRKAKLNFTKVMGIRSTEYGSIFLYKNGIRIYPFGEPDEDSWSLDSRRSKRLGDYVGTNDLIGRIEILGDNNDFKETTSRGDGLIKNYAYEQLKDYFIDSVITKLESYRRHIVRFGIDLDQYKDNKQQVINLITDLSNDNEIIKISFNNDLLEIIDNIQSEKNSAAASIKRIKKVAEKTNNELLLKEVNKVEKELTQAVDIVKRKEKELAVTRKLVKETDTENLFLKSLKTNDFEDIVGLMHQIGITSGIISKSLKVLLYKIKNELPISNDELKEKLGLISMENQKNLSISRFATKANFRFDSEKQTIDLIMFIKEYIRNIAVGFNKVDINVETIKSFNFSYQFKPLEIIILVDNLISNSIKAQAQNILIEIVQKDNNTLLLYFDDDGKGIPNSYKSDIFKYGFTTTNGSGLGLNHIRSILSKIDSTIELVEKDKKGTKFLITFKK
jgi:signal transduction histidine kinase